jgi:twitching motility protein PilT
MEISELLAFAKKNKASDVHLISNHPPMLRIHGDIIPVRVHALHSSEVISMLHSIMSDKSRIEYEQNYEADFAVNFNTEGRFRVNAFTTINGPAAVLRSIPTQVQTLEELRLPNTIQNFAHLNKGLVLVTGPTGSGKSTTLAAIIDHINQHQSRHILTIEDPIEFVHKSARSLVNQREVGSHTKSFATALRSALREDPDVILVGELRDLETMRLALTAAETGHLVFATLHTSSAAKTIDRIIDVFPEGDKAMARTMIAGSLEAVITQLLVKTSDGAGRMAVNEILIANSAVRNLIRDSKIPQIYSIMQVSSKIGMRVMKDSVYELLKEQLITPEEAKRILNLEKGSHEDDAERGIKGNF